MAGCCHGAEQAGEHMNVTFRVTLSGPGKWTAHFAQNHSCFEPRSSWGMSIVGKTTEKIKQGICLAVVVGFSSNH